MKREANLLGPMDRATAAWSIYRSRDATRQAVLILIRGIPSLSPWNVIIGSSAGPTVEEVVLFIRVLARSLANVMVKAMSNDGSDPATSVLMTLCPMVIARADLAEVERVKETVRPVLERMQGGRG